MKNRKIFEVGPVASDGPPEIGDAVVNAIRTVYPHAHWVAWDSNGRAYAFTEKPDFFMGGTKWMALVAWNGFYRISALDTGSISNPYDWIVELPGAEPDGP